MILPSRCSLLPLIIIYTVLTCYVIENVNLQEKYLIWNITNWLKSVDTMIISQLFGSSWIITVDWYIILKSLLKKSQVYVFIELPKYLSSIT